MLFNFCDTRLKPEIQCSTISTEGYEIGNLISNSSNGFLAYSCMKPPVNIDITFMCNIRINHILIWTQVGSQKSSGFQLYVKNINDVNTPYTLLSTGFLSNSDQGIMFYPFNVKHETIATPSNFLKRYIKPSLLYLSTSTNNLRVCICKTENSVPAIGKIEVWGSASPRCGKDTIDSVSSLWNKCEVPLMKHVRNDNCDSPKENLRKRAYLNVSLDVPESFLDAITCEIMIQPVLLPSGKIIDQVTLQKHEESQALWGRSPSDPFTGVPFSEHYKPVVATMLKMRIDKFLLDNSNTEEVKKLPRVLGKAPSSNPSENQLMEMSKYVAIQDTAQRSTCNTIIRPHYLQSRVQTTKTNRTHTLPTIVAYSKHTANRCKPIKKLKLEDLCASKDTNSGLKQEGDNVVQSTEKMESNIDIDVNALAPDLLRFSEKVEKKPACISRSCKCCDNSIFYQLPCNHVICRKVLTSITNEQCKLCGLSYKSSEVTRFFD